MPPAAPAPGCAGLAAQQRRQPGQRPRPAQRPGPALAPFCGPNTAAAPAGPSSGARTSVRQATPPGGGGRSPDRSAAASPASAPPPRARSRAAASGNRAPSAASAPVPPSVEAEPPSPITIRRAPASSARADQLADPGGVRAERVGLRQQRQPGGAGQLDDVHGAGQLQPPGGDRARPGPADLRLVPAGRRARRRPAPASGALAAVGQRQAGHLVGRAALPASRPRWPRRPRRRRSCP